MVRSNEFSRARVWVHSWDLRNRLINEQFHNLVVFNYFEVENTTQESEVQIDFYNNLLNKNLGSFMKINQYHWVSEKSIEFRKVEKKIPLEIWANFQLPFEYNFALLNKFWVST